MKIIGGFVSFLWMFSLSFQNFATESFDSSLKANLEKILAQDEIAFDPNQVQFFDGMLQIDTSVDMEQVSRLMKKAGIGAAFLFSRHQRAEAAFDQAIQKFSSQLVPGTSKRGKVWKKDQDAFVKSTEEALRSGKYYAMGELLLRHNEKNHDDMEEVVVSPGADSVQHMVDLAKKYHVIVYVHLEATHLNEDLEVFENLLVKNKEVSFVWSQGGWASASLTEKLLKTHSNLWIALAKRHPRATNLKNASLQNKLSRNIFLDYEQGILLPEWKKILISYSEKIFFATDCHTGKRYQRRMVEYTNVFRKAIASLPEEVARNISYRTGIKLFLSVFAAKA